MSRKQEEPSSGAPEWMATYGDLVTLLLCFFIMLFAMSSVDAAKFQAMADSFSNNPISITSQSSASDGINDMLGAGIMFMSREAGSENKLRNQETLEKAQEELKVMSSDFKTYFAENDLLDKVDVKLNEDSVELVFNDGLLFDTGRAVLKPEAMEVLNIISVELLKYPENDIEVVGHTDTDPINTPQYPSNWFLSSARAIAVGSYFIDNDVQSMEPYRFTCVGRGEYLPVAPNDTPENKAKNRRVELKIKSRYYSNN